MKEFRCENDNKLLMKACLVDADVEIKCKACGMINSFKVSDAQEKYLCYKLPCENRVDHKQFN